MWVSHTEVPLPGIVCGAQRQPDQWDKALHSVKNVSFG
jgi:hypothetical protein